MLLDDESQDNNNGNVKIGSLALNQDDIITRCKFMNDDFISPTYRLDHSVFQNTANILLNDDPDSMDSNANFVPSN